MAWEDLTEAEKGYIAGFLDGEGSICIHKHNTIHYRLSIIFYNSHKGVIDWLEKKLGYKSIKRSIDKRRDKLHTKDNYAVYIRKNSDSLNFLKDCLNYLIVKKKQAKNAIEFLEAVLNRVSFQYTNDLIKKLKKHSELNKQLNRGDSLGLG